MQSLQPPPPKERSTIVLEELPLAPDPEPKKLTEEEKRVIFDKEEVSLRELRIFLREICAKLARNRQWVEHWKICKIDGFVRRGGDEYFLEQI